ncbi:hypothetical protein G4V39_02500 [Thermosulfuriphilus ammonigenes]|uniref:TPM domain-containing protein n=1 Tax=Thermosulfuriphilus ammonigenes TaxID=1936021 RepID=A0A6G7PUI2_9BACT|nr:hypothetical protein [Thermosulfuriphilus ammonigenes]MBA2848646.1 putative membrane protein [Thermosulfuriphilus ammonigenes]QIJ71216.1 hypothetical protein G4V39_02500 [Thermosulfuriphilus ammonigenes]
MKPLFNQEAQRKVAQAVAEAEAKTSAEIAVMVVGHSGRYREAEILAAILWGHLLAFLITVNLKTPSLWLYIPQEFIYSGLFFLLTRRFPWLKRPFISPGRRKDKVRLRAQRAFFEHGLHLTREATGVLIFISLFERRVMILADRGVMAKVSQESLDHLATRLARAMREGRASEGLCEVIRQLGELLSRHLPPRPDDTNELPNEIIIRQE